MSWWLLRQLKASNPRTRRQAVEKLAAAGSAKIAEALFPLLQDRDLTVRKAAATALGKIKDDRAVGPLMAALQNPLAGSRLEAALALGNLADLRAAPALAAALRDSDGSLRKTAALALRSIGWKPDTTPRRTRSRSSMRPGGCRPPRNTPSRNWRPR